MIGGRCWIFLLLALPILFGSDLSVWGKAQKAPTSSGLDQQSPDGGTKATPTSTPNGDQEGGAVQGDLPPGISPEARIAVEEGVRLLQADRPQDAVKPFMAAVRKHPNNAQFRHLLAVAFAKNKQLGDAWLQVRASVQLNPNYEPAVKDFLDIWRAFDTRGDFNVGVTPESIEKAIGKPDAAMQSKTDPTRVTWQYGFMRLNFFKNGLFSVYDPRGVTPEMARPIDSLKVPFEDKDWKLGYRSINNVQTISEFVPGKETVQKWTQMVTVQRLNGMSERGKTPKIMMGEIEENLKKINPAIQIIPRQVIPPEADAPNGVEGVIFEMLDPGSEGNPAQVELVRLVSGSRDIYRLAYSRQASSLTDAERTRWMGFLQVATLEKVDLAPADLPPGDTPTPTSTDSR